MEADTGGAVDHLSADGGVHTLVDGGDAIVFDHVG